VQYSRNQSLSDSKTMQRVSGKGTENSNFSLTYNYNAQDAVRALPGSSLSDTCKHHAASVGRATKTANDRHVCHHEKTARTMSGSFVRDEDQCDQQRPGRSALLQQRRGPRRFGQWRVWLGS